MEKIGFPSSATFQLNSEKKGKKKAGKSRKSTKTFSNVLNTREAETLLNTLPGMEPEEHEKLEEILDDVYQLGELLKSEQSISSLKRYRDSIKHFFKYVVDNGIEAEKIVGIRNPRTMEQKQYTLVRVVDRKLERLAEYILSSQKDQIDLLGGVDEIYGLLVNFTS